MNIYRNALPQLGNSIFLSDGGMETTLLFTKGIDLPHFASFPLLDSPEGVAALTDYYKTYAQIAVQSHCGFILDTPTWRANSDWATLLGYSPEQLADINRRGIKLMTKIRDEYASQQCPMVISGTIGPRGDGYQVDTKMTVTEAVLYHGKQINTFVSTEADMVTAFTLTYLEEAIGISLAAKNAKMPVALSFTTEIDGRLPCGTLLADAIEQVDAATNSYPAYYMINCSHPDHFSQALAADEPWVKRIRGIKANASRLSHAELDAAEFLDSGNPTELGQQYRVLLSQFPHFNILGGCCGTDDRHISAIGSHCCTMEHCA
jgi:S-methylmethionine-dependent homocysteine/selenocysteine methylase